MNLYLRLVSLPLRVKLLIGFVLSILPVFAVAAFAYLQNAQSTTLASHTLIEQLSRDRVSTVNDALLGAKDTTVRIASDASNVTAYAQLTTAPDDVTANKQISDAFRQILNTQPGFQQIRFVSISGRVLVSFPPATNTDDAKLPYFQ